MTSILNPIEAASGPRQSSGDRAFWYQAGALLFLVAFLYRGILFDLASEWWNDPNFSHGFFVPLFSGFVIWKNRSRLAALKPSPSWLGLAITAGALVILIIGVLGAELFLSRSSFVLLLAGLVIQFKGWAYYRKLIFAWACLFLMIPIPTLIFNQVAFPLQLLASRLASSSLALVEVPVLRQGNVLMLPAMSLEVAQACSGIRSLITLTTLATIYGFLLEAGVLRRVLLVIAAIPIAILANGLRIVGTGLLVYYWDPEKAEGFFHTFEGWVIFVFSLVILFLFHRLMSLVNPQRAERRS